MGAAVSTSTASSVQTATNNTYQKAQNDCTATCNQLISGNVIVLDNSKAGNITFTQRCSADASCYMKNAVDQAVQAFQEAKVGANASPALFPGIQVNTTVSSNRQEITNDLTQIMNNLCHADVNQTIQDNVVYATDSTLGNIGFLQEGNASAKCVMENSARLQLQMKQEGTTTSKAGGGISIGAGIVGLIILLIIIIVVLRALSKANKPQDGGMGGMGGGGGGQQGGGGGGGMNFQSMFGGGGGGGSSSGRSRSSSSRGRK